MTGKGYYDEIKGAQSSPAALGKIMMVLEERGKRETEKNNK